MKGTWQTTDSSGSSGLVLAVIAAAVLIGSGALTAIVHAVVMILIMLGCTVALAVVGGIALLVYRTRSDALRRPIPARPVVQLPPGTRPGLEESSKPVIEPARELHVHFHGLTPGQIAAIVTQRGTYLEEDR